MVLIGVLLIVCFVIYGLWESGRNEEALSKLRVRVNVNGIRGKSTVTRLVTAILAEAGYNVVGKTTGTAARFITSDLEEESIARKPEGANIKEQLACIRRAADLGAEAMVCECMAVNPEYQVVVQDQMLKANICVIVNILEDHLDVMGPTLIQIAEAFSKTIPYDGYCVTVPSPYNYILEKECRLRNTKLIVVNENEISDEYIDAFSYEIFPANLALAFGVADVLGISRDVALRGALKANPDPGAARVVRTEDNDIVFVNGFAANEPTSTWAIWDRVSRRGILNNGVVVLFNGRLDRVDRTQQFVRDFFPQLPAGTSLICMGGGLSCVKKAYKAGKFPGVHDFNCFEGRHVVARVLDLLSQEDYQGKCVFGIGNIHGEGSYVLEAMDFGFAPIIAREGSVLSRYFGGGKPSMELDSGRNLTNATNKRDVTETLAGTAVSARLDAAPDVSGSQSGRFRDGSRFSR